MNIQKLTDVRIVGSVVILSAALVLNSSLKSEEVRAKADAVQAYKDEIMAGSQDMP